MMGDGIRQLQERIKSAMADRNTRLAVFGVAAVVVAVILVILFVTVLGGQQSLPVAPSSLQASAISYNRVDLTWVDNSDNEAEFEIQRAEVNEEDSFLLLSRISADETTHSDTKVAEGVTYYYRIKAINSAGHSDYTNVATVEVPKLEPPNAPSNLAAVGVSSGRIDLTWWDMSDNEDGFKIERRTDEEAWKELQIDPPLGPNVNEYSDADGLVEETVYYYRIRSYNPKGHSMYSEEAWAQTLPPVEHEMGGTAWGWPRRVSVVSIVSADRYCKYNPYSPRTKYCEAPAGSKYAVVTVSVTNITEDLTLTVTRDCIQLRNTYSKDTRGIVDYPQGDVGDPFPSSVELEPAGTVSGVILYLIPDYEQLDELEVVTTTGGDTIHVWRR
jgi:hypothetical protein